MLGRRFAASRLASFRARAGLLALIGLLIGAGLLSALAADSGTGEQRAAASLPPEKDRWIRVETAHFLLFSNASESYTREVGSRLETFREVLARLHPGLRVDSPLPTFIYVFRNDESFTPYKKVYGGAAVDMSGYFIGHRDGNYVALNASPQGDPFEPIYHEYVHHFLTNNFTRLPLWLNEGLAECYRTIQIDGGQVAIGRPLDDYVGMLRRAPLLPLRDLLATDENSRQYNESNRSGLFYGESWLLVHVLIWGKPQWRARLPELIGRLDAGASLRELVAPMSLDDLQKALADALKQGKFLYSRFELGDLQADAGARVTPMPREDVLARLGDFLAHSDERRAREAEEHFQEALRLNPRHAASYAGLGFLRDAQNKLDEAAGFYDKSLGLDPDDPRTCFLYATSLIRRSFPPGISSQVISGEPPAALVRARELFARSIKLRPDWGEAYAGLGATYVFASGDLSDGVAALETARRMLPARQDIAFNLVGLYGRSGRRDQARSLIDTVIARFNDPALTRRAEESLLHADIVSAEKLLDSGDLEAGLRRLEETVPKLNDPQIKARVQARIQEVQRVERERREVDLYNQAVERFNKNDRAAGCALLEQVAREATDPKLQAQARKALEQGRRSGACPGRARS